MKHDGVSNRTLSMLACAFLLPIMGCAPSPQGQDAGKRQVAPSERPTGYLAKEAVPDSLLLLPPPPAAGSAALAYDEEVHTSAQALRDSARYRLATLDADLTSPQAAGAFACALAAPIDAQSTPRLHRLMQRTLLDASASTAAAKRQYQRTRPFVAHAEPTCSPKDEPILRNNGSYPSGHTTIGWIWALTLAEVDPAHAGAILARGRSFGESRLVCNVHWESDILEGFFLGASVVSQLHTVDEFRRDLAAARDEVTQARAMGLPTGRDCALEAEALTQKIPGVL